MAKQRSKKVTVRLGNAPMAVDQAAAPADDAEATAPVASGAEPQPMEAEKTLAKPKLKLRQPPQSKLGVQTSGKRGQNSKVQKARKLKKLAKALSHHEKLTTRHSNEEETLRRRQAAKTLWGNDKEDNRFALLAS